MDHACLGFPGLRWDLDPLTHSRGCRARTSGERIMAVYLFAFRQGCWRGCKLWQTEIGQILMLFLEWVPTVVFLSCFLLFWCLSHQSLLNSDTTAEKQVLDFLRLKALIFEFSLLLIEKLFLSIPYAFMEIFNTVILSISFYSKDNSACVCIAHQVTPLKRVSQHCRHYGYCFCREQKF